MSKTSVVLLLTSLVVGGSTNSRAGPMTGSTVTDSFIITVNCLNKMRVFAKACGLSKNSDSIAQDFMSLYSLQSGLSFVEINKFVQDAYDAAPEATGISRECDMQYVRFWAGAFRERAHELDEALTRYKQHK